MKPLAKLFSLILVLFGGNSLLFAQTCPGCLDPSFGGGSIVRVPDVSTATIRDLVRQSSDGKIIALVPGHNIADGQRITRLNADGTVDTSFGPGGTLTFQWKVVQRNNTYYGSVLGLGVQNVGGTERILIAGDAPLLSGNKVIAKRLRVDRLMLSGSPDPSWGTNGTVLLNLDGAATLIVDPVDQSIVVGTGNTNQLIRLTAAGQLDTSFGSGGVANSTYPVRLHIDAQRRILVAGWVTNRNGTLSTPTVTRHKPDGKLDTSFGSNGTARVGFNLGTAYVSVSTDSFNHVIFSNSTGTSDTTDFGVERFTDSGIPDPTFSGDGIATIDFNGQRDLAMASAPQSDGSIVIVGNTAVVGTGNGSDIAVARLDYYGNLDVTFGSGGRIVFPHTPGGESMSTILMVTDPNWTGERFYAAGINSQANQLLVARFLEF